MFGLISPLDLAVAAGYFYVGLAAYRAESKAGATTAKALAKATTWPATIWNTINKLYKVKPGD